MSANIGAVLRTATPSDDAGAETYDRYEWQSMVATGDLLALYLDALDNGIDPAESVDRGLVCEFHEDWSRVRNGQTQIVSGKHKEPRFGAFTTVKSLIRDGGVYHLFDRWLALGSSPACRLATTAGLDSDAALIQQICTHYANRGHRTPLPNAHCEKAFDRLSKEVEQLRAVDERPPIVDLREAVLPRFLACLTFDVGLPRRDHMPGLAPSAYAQPIATATGHPELAVQVWEATLTLVRGRMRAAGPARRGLLPELHAATEADLERRTVTVADAHVAMIAATETPGAFTPLPSLTITNRMAIKMAEGQCSATSIERAEALRRRFNSWRRDQRSRPGGRESELALQLLLLRAADRATAAVRSADRPWGAPLWSELEDRLELEASRGSALGLDPDMLLGGVSELTNACKIWFSEPFDARARLEQFRRRQQ